MDDQILFLAKAMLPGFPPNLRPLILALLHMMELRQLMRRFEEDNELLQKTEVSMNMEEILSHMMGSEGKEKMEQARQFMDMMEMMNTSQEEHDDATL